MPKKILFHSAIHQFLAAAKACQVGSQDEAWPRFVDSLRFSYSGKGEVEVTHQYPTAGAFRFSVGEANLYQRGDRKDRRLEQTSVASGAQDAVRLRNAAFFQNLVLEVATRAGLRPQGGTTSGNLSRIQNEAEFHDRWAASNAEETVDVVRANEACTAPEMRYIMQELGDLRGRHLLDVGCGLGEASVYFARKGADVTASDLSSGMLEHTSRLAAQNGVQLQTLLSSSDSLQLPPEAKFDVIYIGNALHHVDIRSTMRTLVSHLSEDGIFVSWDPLAYNPLINLYRRIAVKVRTEDEHPLTKDDIRTIRSCFGESSCQYFWLSTLLVFILMVLQRRNPNKERFWKKVVEEGERWAWIYQPLERLDQVLLRLVPPLGWLCWNVVIVGQRPCRP